MQVPTYLVKSRQNRYYFRIIVPSDLRPVIGKCEIRRSVRTTDLTLATARSLQLAYHWHNAFEKLRMKDDFLNDPLLKNLTLKNVRRGDFFAEEVVIDTPEDVAYFNQISDASQNSGSFTDKPISKLIQEYLNDNKDKWKPNVYKEYKSLYRQVIELMGDVPVQSVTRQRARSLKESLQAVRRKGKPLSVSSINKTLGKMSSVWKYAIQENFGITYNPWSGLQLKEKQRQTDDRSAYELSDLEQLFADTLIQSVNSRPARYWLPILSLFHGFRIGEIAQLTVDDIITVEDIHCIQIRSTMRLKNSNAARIVPIHKDIFSLGFLEFVAWRRSTIEKTSTTDRRLFIDLNASAARPGGPISNWWNNKYSTKFNTTPGTSFHSLRHTCITQMRAAGHSETHVAEIVGHKRGNTQSFQRYGKSQLKPLTKVLDSVSYSITIPPWSAVSIQRIALPKKK